MALHIRLNVSWMWLSLTNYSAKFVQTVQNHSLSSNIARKLRQTDIMEKRTKELLLKLESEVKKSLAFQIVNENHSMIKNGLLAKGIRFHDEDSQFSETIVGNQTIRGAENVELMKSYEEINYIKDIFKENIYTMADEQERFNPIREKTIEIISRYEKK